MYILLGVTSPVAFSVCIIKRQGLLPQSFVQNAGYLQLYGAGIPDGPDLDEHDEFPVPFSGGGGELEMGVVEDERYKDVVGSPSSDRDDAHSQSFDATKNSKLNGQATSNPEERRDSTHSHSRSGHVSDSSTSVDRSGLVSVSLSRRGSDDLSTDSELSE